MLKMQQRIAAIQCSINIISTTCTSAPLDAKCRIKIEFNGCITVVLKEQGSTLWHQDTAIHFVHAASDSIVAAITGIHSNKV